ncbi:ribosomal-processing cysteine protease Prp [Alicyclobacillus pomorum]|uniref:ribosomal-processing cysteine protease Prp n=1 Tax=Alicyclobacillus pomorum TaxID=204470 RepID=UPI00041F44A7|nr:ribosomal-processing cysteine protease Prp [Alicyclobacillus pomorum]
MIFVSVFESSDRIHKVHASGHAGYAEHGMDIVCSAVSVLLYNAVNSCEALLGAELSASDETDPFVVEVPQQWVSHDGVQLLLRSMEFGLRQIAEQYPEYLVVQTRPYILEE